MDALIIDGVRTPRGKGRSTGSLHHLHPQVLMAQCLQALEERQGFEPSDVDDVLVGNATNAGDHGGCIARLSVLAAGWPVEAPGLTLHRFCGSGQQAVNMAAMGIRAGFQDLVVAGGVESMSRFAPAQPGEGMAVLDGNNHELREVYPFVPQGISADLLATLEASTARTATALPSPASNGRPRPWPPAGSTAASSPSTTPTARLPWITTSTRGPIPRPRGWPSSRRHSRSWAPPWSTPIRSASTRCAARSTRDRRHRPRTPRRQLLGRGGRRLSHAAGLTRLRPAHGLEARARLVMGRRPVPNR